MTCGTAGRGKFGEMAFVLLLFLGATAFVEGSIDDLKHSLTPKELSLLKGSAELSGWLEFCNGDVAKVGIEISIPLSQHQLL